MKVAILYRPKSEHGSGVEAFAHDFQTRHGSGKIELVNIDEREGIALESLYDIVQYPAILAISVDGSLLKMWQGQIPLMDEVASYIYTV